MLSTAVLTLTAHTLLLLLLLLLLRRRMRAVHVHALTGCIRRPARVLIAAISSLDLSDHRGNNTA
jgi:hypothetical protein